MDTNLTGKVALVTGGSRGIGRAIALGFARAGAQIVIASRKQAGVDAVAAEIRDLGGTALGIAAHVGEESAITSLVEKALAACGHIDVLVHNAATTPHFGPLLDATAAQWDKIMQVNLRGVFLLCQQVVPGMRQRGGGSIINIASIEGLRPSKVLGVYSVSKAALILLTQALAQELGPSGIRVNALAPGLIRTDFSAALWHSPELADAVAARTPLKRLGEPEDVVGAALFLASSASAYVNGAVITVDGGLTAGGPLG
ncbi:MAG: SDR family oxidoreductase [Chloroflexi bacterium]|nr:SDR family oxidoreductase [Chloroflexota bacterium]